MAIEPVSDRSSSDDFKAHMHGYSEFTRLFKYAAIVAFAIGLLVLFIL